MGRQQKIFAALASILCISSSAQADEEWFAVLMKLHDVFSVLAAESPCGLTYNEAAVEWFIEHNFDTSSTKLAGAMVTASEANRSTIEAMSPSEKRIMCNTARKTAISWKLILTEE